MMNKKESPRILAAKYLLVVPVLAAALLTMQIPGLQAKEPADADNPTQVNVTIRSADGSSSVIHVDGKKDTPVDMLFTDKDGEQLTLTAMGMSMSVPDSGKKENRLSELTIDGAATAKDMLVILDGKEVSYNDINNIVTPAEVQSINVYKEQPAREKYGIRAANGVIVITTKNGADFISLTSKKLFKLNFSKQNNDSIIPDYRTRQGIPQTSSGDNDLTEYYLKNQPSSETKDQNSSINTSPTTYVYGYTDQVKFTSEDGSGVMTLTTDYTSLDKNNQQPMFIVDGVVVTSFKGISPTDIESLTVLNGKTAADLYGKKAKNGVILITTKKK